MGTEIKMDSEAVGQIVQRAILEELGAEQRERIFEQALASLLHKPRDRFGSPGESPLEQAFNNALATAAHRVAREVVDKNEELRERLREMLGDVIAKLLSEEYGEAHETVARAMTSAISEMLGNRR